MIDGLVLFFLLLSLLSYGGGVTPGKNLAKTPPPPPPPPPLLLLRVFKKSSSSSSSNGMQRGRGQGGALPPHRRRGWVRRREEAGAGFPSRRPGREPRGEDEPFRLDRLETLFILGSLWCFSRLLYFSRFAVNFSRLVFFSVRCGALIGYFFFLDSLLTSIDCFILRCLSRVRC